MAVSAKKREQAAPESDASPFAPHPRHALNFIGNEAAERQLLDAWRTGRLPHAIVLGGKEGVGKATLAWRFARFLLANPNPPIGEAGMIANLAVDPDSPARGMIASLSAPDVCILRRAWNATSGKHYTEIRVDDARRALHMFHHKPAQGGWRICIIDAADDLNRASANALLKLIEEPPPRSLFLLAAHSPGRLLPTIRSRCRKIMLAPLAESEISQIIHGAEAHGFTHPAAEIAAAARAAGGSAREAFRLLAHQGAASLRKADGLLKRLPQIDWGGAQALADDLAKPQSTQDFNLFLENIFIWLDRRLRDEAEQGSMRVAPYAAAWEKIHESAQTLDALNLDKRPFILSAFEDLQKAAQGILL